MAWGPGPAELAAKLRVSEAPGMAEAISTGRALAEAHVGGTLERVMREETRVLARDASAVATAFGPVSEAPSLVIDGVPAAPEAVRWSTWLIRAPELRRGATLELRYATGWDEPPDAVREALLLLAAACWNRPDLTLMSAQLGTLRAEHAGLAAAHELLRPYRKP